MYFDSFPLIPYDAVGNNDFVVLTNLCKRTGIIPKIKNTSVLYDTYDVKDGEMPEHGVLSVNARRGSTFFISKSGFADCYTHIKNRTKVVQRNHHMANRKNK